MIFWSVLAVYVLGWVLSVRPALRRHMLAERCVACRRVEPCSVNWGGRHDGPIAPRGSISDRNGLDAAAAIGRAMWWPLRLVLVAVAFVCRMVGRGIGGVVLAGELTGPELERRLREQEAEIARLSKQITEENQ